MEKYSIAATDESNRSFVGKGSIVRQIWGKADTVLFIFAGAAAEFSLNKAVDWLYFTGRLPADPIGRLFSTVGYARQIIFSSEERALQAIDHITAIHSGVEQNRGFKIPDWAYRDVLYMLIYHSIAAFELLERKMTEAEKEEAFVVFLRVGERMGIPGLPPDSRPWLELRHTQLKENLERSNYTNDLYRQYRKHLGAFRYRILLMVQSRLLPETAAILLGLKPSKVLPTLLAVYKFANKAHLEIFVKRVFLPARYYHQIQQMNL